MLNPCIECGNHFPGLGWFIPDEAWLAIAPSLGAGELCPWCADKRLAALDLHVRAFVHLDLGHFHGYDRDVLREQEALARRMHPEQAAKGGV